MVGGVTSFVGAWVGSLVGTIGAPPPTQVPVWQRPKGNELQGVESDTYCGEGQLPPALQGTVSSHSLSLPHEQACSSSCLYVQKPPEGYSSPALR